MTTAEFLSRFGFNSLPDLPDKQMVEDASVLNKDSLLSGELHELFEIGGGDEASAEDQSAMSDPPTDKLA